ncbi:DUF397 domain-containing protein [Nocardia bovistercoris]|uniref:DUF397 domain-containing protein n=1 Tax=Nocardia bovistercoris TaxID=2785916 RepID=A0A931ICF3_9NOCA|nr:DUF397 domain-containing protein [Nocardia bovistercoris]
MEVDLTGAVWRKSVHSGPDGNCVAVANLRDGNVAVRDTKDKEQGRVLAFTPNEWDAFLTGIVAGEFGRA